jgi:uncharacterized protein YdiU (UPF0061 family)
MPDINIPAASRIPFDNSYARLPPRFHARLAPIPVAAPTLIHFNDALALALGLDPAFLATPEGVAILAGNVVADGSEPLSMAYAGHQFGNWVPQLGDGRAVLLGEVVGTDGIRRDIQLKGAGRTPFSRGGDGRAALGPVLREYIVSEAMAALGVPTTRSLAAVSTGEHIMRDGVKPGAVLTRVAQSHVRIGTFEFFANRGDAEGVRLLADYIMARHYPETAGAAQPYRALLDAIIARTAALVSRWMGIGFIHGVMNTDNMSVAGETIDYGPCAFMDSYHAGTVYSSIDHAGRYAYANQPRIAHWNLSRLAGAFLPLLADDQQAALPMAQAALDAFPDIFQAEFEQVLRRKLGLTTAEAGDMALAQDLLARMEANGADFTLTFRRLADSATGDDAPIRALFADPAAFDDWAVAWRARLAREPMPESDRGTALRRANPAFIPRNHRIEAVIRAAEDRADFAPLNTLVTVLAAPFDDQPEFADYANPPLPDEIVHQTFCGT